MMLITGHSVSELPSSRLSRNGSVVALFGLGECQAREAASCSSIEAIDRQFAGLLAPTGKVGATLQRETPTLPCLARPKTFTLLSREGGAAVSSRISSDNRIELSTRDSV
jgi:hypothetical protein